MIRPIEYRAFETRPHQAPIPLNATPSHADLDFADRADRVAQLNKLVDQVAGAYAKDRAIVSIEWRRLGMSGGDWSAFP